MKKIGLASFRHRVLLCSQKDVVIEDATLRLRREGVAEFWAKIEPKKATEFTVHGMASKDTRNRRTHVITLRYRYDLNLSDMAWVYEARVRSSPRWYKVLNVEEIENSRGQFWNLECRLVERSDDLVEPTEAATGGVVQPLPSGVEL